MTVYSSRRSRLAIPDDVDLYTFLFERTHETTALDHKTAVIDGPTGESYTFAQLRRRVDQLAAGLAQLGLHQGDVLAIFAPNHVEYPIAFLAAARLGAFVTTANPTYTAHELNFQLVDTGAKFLITLPELLHIAKNALDDTKVLEIFVFGNVGVAGARPVRSLYRYAQPPPIPRFDPKTYDIVIPYSSGTTGRPKGTELTHFNLISNLVQIEDYEYHSQGRDPSEETLLGVLPLYHIYGMVVILLGSIHHRQTLVLMPKFELNQFATLLANHKITIAYIVPPIVIGLIKSGIAAKFDMSSLRQAISGAAPLMSETEAIFPTTPGLTHVKLKQAYGMTELSPVSHYTPSDHIKIGSIGRLVANCEARIVDPETGKDVPRGGEGELWVRGPNVMKGYLNNPKATAETIVQGEWLRTGDIVRIDDDDFFFVTDRLKELIKFKGLQVAPAELEGIILSHPKVQDCAVIPHADKDAGEIPRAYIVLNPGVTASAALAEEISKFVETKVAPHKKLRGGIEFIDVIPKSASGKILRRVLRMQNEERLKAKL